MNKISAVLLAATIIAAMVIPAVVHADGQGTPALLRLWADQGEYVGTDADAWIHESWVVTGTASFTLYVDAMKNPVYNVMLAVAVNDPSKITSITIGSNTIYSSDFTEGYADWPSGKNSIPKHDVYPTYYAMVEFGDVDSNYGNPLTSPYGSYNGYRAETTVEIDATGDVMVHFDAYGDNAVCPFSKDLTWTSNGVVPPQATISGVKFYDANVNGIRDSGEDGIEGWKIELYKWDEDYEDWVWYDFTYTGSTGDYIFTVNEPGTYRVVEVMPSGMWIQTAPGEIGYYEIEVKLGEIHSGLDFGNVCLMPGYGGKTLGYWTNKNGQALITSSDVSALKSLNLYKPSGWNYPPFSDSLATAKTQIRNYLLSATAKDTRWMLSAQLIATKLNELHGFLSSGTIVYVGSSTYVPTGFISIDNIMNNANTALSGTDRAEQEYWKNLLDGLNNNWLPFVCPSPCLPIEYP